jgi:cold shock protein
MTGRIIRITRDKGFGFIKGQNNQDYFFHKSALKNVAFADLTEGQDVTFEDSEGEKGLRAEDIYV